LARSAIADMNDANTTVVHNNPWFSVVHRPDVDTPGATGWFRVVRPDSVIVLGTSHDGDLLMIEGIRDTTGPNSCFELPSGTIEAGERAEDAALRELREETGFTAHTLLRVGEFVEAPGVSASRCIVFEVQLLNEATQSLELGEHWTPRFCSLGEIRELQLSGRIVDGATLAALRFWDLRTFRR
jgi:ADP-ribose pyrophosphatase